MSVPDDPQAYFHCQRCNTCCQGEGGILYDPGELPAAAAYLGVSTAEFQELYCRLNPDGRWEILTGEGGYCRMMGPNGCRIHPVKPRICRHWPFLENILTRREAFHGARQGCPGIDPDVAWEDFVAWARVHHKREPLLP